MINILQAAVVYYILMKIQRGLDYNILNNLNEVNLDDECRREQEDMSLAPHRFEMPDFTQSVWYFSRTHTSMNDFVYFVEHESTQVKMEPDFYLGIDRKRSAKDGNLIP